jgi:hypothetical protein
VYGGLWAVQFCVGMEHVLRCGVAAHRDIKPGNLLIDSGVFLKIADFGVALAVSQHPGIVDDLPKRPSQLQRLQPRNGHLTCGTPGYIAPELFTGGKVSPQSDIFSFGITLWQLAARSLASPYGVGFSGDPNEYQRAILKKALAHAVSRIDSPYFEVIRRCLTPDPARRYPDFTALREAVKSAAKAANVRVVDFIVVPGFHGSFEDYVNRGRSYIVLGRYERALRILDRAVKHNPSSPEALVAQAEALIHRGQLVPAVRAYGSAHRLVILVTFIRRLIGSLDESDSRCESTNANRFHFPHHNGDGLDDPRINFRLFQKYLHLGDTPSYPRFLPKPARSVELRSIGVTGKETTNSLTRLRMSSARSSKIRRVSAPNSVRVAVVPWLRDR